MRVYFLLGLMACLSACSSGTAVVPPLGSAYLEPTQPLLDAAPRLPVLSEAWQVAAPGIEVRVITPPQALLAQMVVVRLDPAQVQFRVHYRPGEPRSIAQWQAELPNARVIVNANFFTPEHLITGMLVSDGQMYGRSFVDRGGMFSIQNGQP
jgi:hypothetical protein